MKKTVWIIFCALVLMLGFSGAVSAATAWDGTVDTDWYTTAPAGAASFEISTPAQLAGLASLVNAGTENFAGKTITLTADLDLGGVYNGSNWDVIQSKEWTPIGRWTTTGFSTAIVFCGTFDGNNKTISNFYHSTISYYRGLFGYIGATGVVKNLAIASGSVTGGERTGALAGYNAGVILNSKNSAAVKTNSNYYTGGIVGYNIGYVVNCMNSGPVSSATYSLGGIAGYSTGAVSSCYNIGTVIGGNTRVGGIVGENVGGTIKNCYNTGDTTSTLVSTSSAKVGGISGATTTGTVKNCYTIGAATGASPATGGILGTSTSTLSNLYYLKTDTVNKTIYSVGASTAVTADAANTYAKNETELKAIAPSLGSVFVADTANLNNGYPVLSWQVSGYPEDENNTLAMDSIAAVNGTITVTMNKTLSYTALALSNFTVAATSNGNPITLQNLAISQADGDSATVATITYTAVEPTSSAQAIHLSVAYKNGTAKTADYTIAVSDEWAAFASSGFDGGSGTLSDPYRVKTAAQLAYVSAQVKAGVNFSGRYIEQTADIDLGSSVDGNGNLVGLNWTAIGPSTTLTFNGNFNGKGYKITGLARVTASTNMAGLFGYAVNARIINVNLVNPIYNTGASGACLIGYATDTAVKNCHVDGGSFVTTNNLGGGLIGSIKSTATSEATAMEVFDCSSSASVSANMAAGLIAYIAYGTVSNGQPTTIGYVYIEDCYATGNISSNARTTTGYIGGLVGDIQIIYRVYINHCYASGNLTSKDAANVGGLVAYALTTGSTRVTDVEIMNSVALNRMLTYTGTATVSNYNRIMGNGALLLSSGYGALKNNYALDVTMINGKMIDSTDANSANGASKTKEDFAVRSTWDEQGFDFTASGSWNWDSNQNMPVLKNTMADYSIDILMQPHDATAYNNKNAVFQIKTKNGVGAHSYQWQNSANGTAWNNVTDATSTVLTVAGNIALNGYKYRCVVTDEGGQTATSNAVTLTVKSKKYTAEIAAANLYKVYQSKGTLKTVREPISLYAYEQNIDDFTIGLRYYGDYYISGSSSSNKPKGNVSWAMLDNIAAGGNPREYVKSGDNTALTKTDLVAEILGSQLADGTFIKQNDVYGNDSVFDNIIYTMSLDIYFDGAKTWGNEQDGAAYGRDGALDYLFSQLKDDNASDGQYFYTMTPFNSVTLANIQKYQAEYAILMSRLVGDDTYGKQAEKAMYNVMELLNYLYDNNQITSTETMGRYLSALIAAANATDNHLKQNAYYDQADEVDQSLETAWALDGTYAAGMNLTAPADTGDAKATAAVMMGLSDYVNDRCALSTMAFTISDEDVLNADLAAISLPSTTTTDLTLAAKGTYGTVFTWQSSASNCIDANGKVTRQPKDIEVTLTVTAKFGTAEVSQTFTVMVPAAQSADGDAVDAAIKALTIPPEAISNLTLPAAGAKDAAIAWSTSNSDVITKDGVVTRPALGSADVSVTLTATVSKGEVSKTKTYSVLVYAQTNDTLTKAYYEVRSYYLTHKDLTKNYWQAFAAYAALGDYIQDPANGYTFYDVSKHKLGETWQGTDYGAVLLEILAMGENPYHYKGVNYVDLAVKNGTGGPYAAPIWATYGLEAAGAKGYSPAVGYSVGQLSESAMAYGVDIAGWAVAELSRHLGEPGVDAAIANFTTLMKANQSSEGYFVYHSMGSNMISTGCVVSGFTALMAAGADGYDVTAAPWLVNGVSPIDTMYKDSKTDTSVGDFSTQLQIEFADLYNTKYKGGNIMWISVGVSKDKLDAQIAKATEILNHASQYTESSIATLKTALDTVNDISNTRLNAKIPDYGEEYFALYDAVRYIQNVDDVAKDQAAADAVTALIAALPDAASVTLADQDDVTAARSAFEALTDDQQALVEATTLTHLTDVEAALSDLKALATAKTVAKAALDSALAAYDQGDYTDANWAALQRAKTDGDTAVDSANDVAAVTAAKDNALAAMTAVAKIDHTETFSDVSDSAWYAQDVAYVTTKGLFHGTSKTTFSPELTMNRAMMVTVLYRLSGETVTPGEISFSDVAADAYYADAVAWAVKAKVTDGISIDRFAPNQVLSRAQAVTFLYRYAVYKDVNLTGTSAKAITEFSDYNQIPLWAMESMTWAYDTGIIQGVSSKALEPAGEVSRAQMAAILHRFVEKTAR